VPSQPLPSLVRTDGKEGTTTQCCFAIGQLLLRVILKGKSMGTAKLFVVQVKHHVMKTKGVWAYSSSSA
jgi:hypothetical protein